MPDYLHPDATIDLPCSQCGETFKSLAEFARTRSSHSPLVAVLNSALLSSTLDSNAVGEQLEDFKRNLGGMSNPRAYRSRLTHARDFIVFHGYTAAVRKIVAG
jgi:hypothetical protein